MGPLRMGPSRRRSLEWAFSLIESPARPSSQTFAAAPREFARLTAPYVRASSVVAVRPMHRLVVSTVALATRRTRAQRGPGYRVVSHAPGRPV